MTEFGQEFVMGPQFRSGVAGIYNRNTYAAEMRGALELWANHLDAVVIPSNSKAA